MIDPVVTGLGGVIVLCGLIVLNAGYDKYEKSSMFASGESTAIGNLRPGTWEKVTGTARRAEDDPLPSFMAGTEGFVVVTVIEQYRTAYSPRAQGQRKAWGRLGWGSYHRQLDVVPFDLTDDTGSVRIDPPTEERYVPGKGVGFIGGRGDPYETSKAEYRLEKTEFAEIEGSEEIPETVQDWADTRARNFEGFPNNGPIRFMQAVLEPGESAVVYGHTARNPDANPDVTQLTLDGGDSPDDFILSDKDIESVGGDFKQEAYKMLAFGILSVLVGLVVVAAGFGLVR